MHHHDNPQAFSQEYLSDYAPESLKPYTQMIPLADNLSSCERDEKSNEVNEIHGLYLVQQLNNPYLKKEHLSYPITTHYLANNRPQDKCGVLSFNEIAENAKEKAGQATLTWWF